jgi:hypothetical protein
MLEESSGDGDSDLSDASDLDDGGETNHVHRILAEKKKTKFVSPRQKLLKLFSVLVRIQVILDAIASFCERVKNIFNATQPLITKLFFVACLFGGILLLFVPLRPLLVIIGLQKVLKKGLKHYQPFGWYKNAKSVSALKVFVGRVPSDLDMVHFGHTKKSSRNHTMFTGDIGATSTDGRTTSSVGGGGGDGVARQMSSGGSSASGCFKPSITSIHRHLTLSPKLNLTAQMRIDEQEEDDRHIG